MIGFRPWYEDCADPAEVDALLSGFGCEPSRARPAVSQAGDELRELTALTPLPARPYSILATGLGFTVVESVSGKTVGRERTLFKAETFVEHLLDLRALETAPL